MNTMEDLRIEVAHRLRATLHGREIDMVEDGKPRLPHMLGITPIGEPHSSLDEDGTLLDSNHYFWQDYIESVDTNNAAVEKIHTAIRSLREDGFFEMTYPYGEEAEIVYCEVEVPTTDNTLQTSCENCDTRIPADPSLLQRNGHYYLNFSLDCPNCEFHRELQRKMNRL